MTASAVVFKKTAEGAEKIRAVTAPGKVPSKEAYRLEFRAYATA